MTLLEARGISVAYGGLVALAGVDLAIEEHQVIALLGPNGSGKTTLFDVLCGLRRPAAGDVWLRGECVTGLPPWQLARRGVGRTFQIPAPFGALSVRDNVLVGVTFQARRPRTRAARLREVERLLTIVGLADRASDAAATLSLGERKRLELALSLSGRPALLLLDELASGLSPKGAHQGADRHRGGRWAGDRRDNACGGAGRAAAAAGPAGRGRTGGIVPGLRPAARRGRRTRVPF